MSQEAFDITAVSKLKHAALWGAAKKLGSQSALARQLGIAPATLGGWINLQRCPSKKMGEDEQKEMEKKLFAVTGQTLDELFPKGLREAEAFLAAGKTIEQTKSVAVSALLDCATAAQKRLTIDDPADRFDQVELRACVGDVLKTLSYREREIIKLRYGLGDGYTYTLEEVAHFFKVTQERIRQIELKAIRKLQDPSRSSRLVDFA